MARAPRFTMSIPSVLRLWRGKSWMAQIASPSQASGPHRKYEQSQVLEFFAVQPGTYLSVKVIPSPCLSAYSKRSRGLFPIASWHVRCDFA
jgi:hypothetical protein